MAYCDHPPAHLKRLEAASAAEPSPAITTSPTSNLSSPVSPSELTLAEEKLLHYPYLSRYVTHLDANDLATTYAASRKPAEIDP